MTVPDLTGAQATMLELMSDTCTVTSDPQSETDDVFDTSTGQWSRPVGDSTVTYSGPCIVRGHERTGINLVAESGFQEQSVAAWTARLPLTATVRAGDILTVTASLRDPSLPGKSFLVVQVLGSTFAVARRVSLEERIPVPHGRADQP